HQTAHVHGAVQDVVGAAGLQDDDPHAVGDRVVPSGASVEAVLDGADPTVVGGVQDQVLALVVDPTHAGRRRQRDVLDRRGLGVGDTGTGELQGVHGQVVRRGHVQ